MFITSQLNIIHKIIKNQSISTLGIDKPNYFDVAQCETELNTRFQI